MASQRKPTPSVPSTPPCRSDWSGVRQQPAGGFTLLELVAALALMLIALGAAGVFLASSRRFMSTQIQRTEAVQALRATIDNLTRDLRLAGACLPTTGEFSPFRDSLNIGAQDQIMIRTGLVRPNLTCIFSNLTATASTNSTALTVASTSGFQAGMGAYIFNPVTLTGQDFIIKSLSGSTIVSDTKMSQSYGTASTVYAAERREYTIDSTVDPPVLNLAINGGTPMPYASGIEALNVRFRLYRNCPPCDTVDPPTTLSGWQSVTWPPLVNEAVLDITARSRIKDVTGDYFRRSATFIANPRNLIPMPTG